MTFLEENLPLVMLASLAAVFSYLFIRRFFWKDDEIREATEWYNKQIDWKVRKEDLEQTSMYIEQSGRVFGLLALVCWISLFYLLIKYY